MSALNGQLATASNVMILDAPLTIHTLPTPATIESENVLITGGGGTINNPYSISRGQNGTAPATHASGTAVTTGWGGGGGGSVTPDQQAAFDAAAPTLDLTHPPLTATALGPFSVTHGAPLANGWILLTELPVGAIVNRVLVFCDEDFSGTGQLQIALGVGFDLRTIWRSIESPDGPTGQTPPPDLIISAVSLVEDLTGDLRAALIGSTGTNGVYATTDSAGTSGHVSVYVLLATPAS